MSKKLPLGAWLSFYIVQSDLCGGRPQPVYSHKGMKEQAATLPSGNFCSVHDQSFELSGSTPRPE